MSDRSNVIASPTRRPFTIAIAGAGIGGLALAIALRRKGYAPIVLERRQQDQVGEEGIFLTLAPNGFNALRGLGLADKVAQKGVVTTGISLFNEDGHNVGVIDYSKHGPSFGAPSVTIRRGALGEVLLAAAQAEGVDIRFGRPIDGLSEDTAGVTLSAGGETLHADVLVAADGLRSAVRRLALPGLPAPVFNGLIGSGGIVDAPGVAPTDGQMKMIFGRRAFFGYIKEGNGPVYWFDSYPSADEQVKVDDPAALLAFLRTLHRDDPLDSAAILAAQRSAIRAYPDYDVPTLPHWHTGQIVLMGDAAHAVTPHSGQGASMALEDALVLAACIEVETSPLAAFRRFQSLRQARVEAAVRLGRQGGQQKKAQSWLAMRIRDLILPWVVPLGQKAQEKMFAFRVDQTPLALPPQ
jgi:2-polyprenyl-6-methoxyphenol hydroxylase-like FAD-dependent oxidoreductase